MSIQFLFDHSQAKNLHYLNRYIKFISSREGKMIKGVTHLHHILPKAKDMFPQFKDLNKFAWNGIHLTLREHFVAHWLLSKIFPGTSQGRAFYHMTNILNKRRSRDYEEAKQNHIAVVSRITQDPIRNKKISDKLKGKPKSPEHIQSLIGHVVTAETREKLRAANLGKKLSDEQRKQMSISRKGRLRSKNSLNSKINIARSVCDYHLVTPMGVFESHLEAAIAYDISPRRFVLIFRNLDVIPRKKVLQELKISVKGKSYKEIGFQKQPKT